MSKFSLVVCDLDNTIYDWYSAFLPAFYEMSRIAAEILNCDLDTLLEQLRQVHIRHADVEHPFSLLETKIVQERAELEGQDTILTLLDEAFHAFNRIRKANLKPFPGSIEALRYLSDSDIKIIAYTDSKFFAAAGRVERLNIGEIFSKIYCREKGVSIIPSNYAGTKKYKIASKIFEIPSHEMKPNPKILLEIASVENVNIDKVIYVGDSISKDILMAKRAGCFAVWAKYGTHTDREMYEKLVRISHWTQSDIDREKNYAVEAKTVVPDFVCERSLDEIKGIFLR
ncbi:HAD family hydrolase [Bosea sp. Root483D1]|uniref:HAD family hydrolase n=1 Tax=Bosea sp. Root483D1 TaxID=1736544 RepID=UPI0009E77A8C|nr:HAD family hydrolase [Bosea sp. Root483D1]